MLESRLYPLLETLTRADLDWLAQEIIAGALAGKVPEEPPEVVQAARSIVFRHSQDSGVHMSPSASEDDARAFSGEEQIDWAARHVVQRLEHVLEMLQHSIDQLDQLVDIDRPDRVSKEPVARISLVLTEGETASKLDRAQLAAAIEGLGALRKAMETWAAEALGGQRR